MRKKVGFLYIPAGADGQLFTSVRSNYLIFLNIKNYCFIAQRIDFSQTHHELLPGEDLFTKELALGPQAELDFRQVHVHPHIALFRHFGTPDAFVRMLSGLLLGPVWVMDTAANTAILAVEGPILAVGATLYLISGLEI